MKKFTRKQMLTAGAVVLLGIGGITVGVVNHNNNVHAQQVAKTKAHEAKVKADKKAKSEQLAKEKEVALDKCCFHKNALHGQALLQQLVAS